MCLRILFGAGHERFLPASVPQWEFQLSDSVWATMDYGAQIELLFLSHKTPNSQGAVGQLSQSMRNRGYSFDFVAMQQTNIHTGKIRQIRRRLVFNAKRAEMIQTCCWGFFFPPKKLLKQFDNERVKCIEAEQLASCAQAQAEQEKMMRVKAEELISLAEEQAQSQRNRCSKLETQSRSERHKRLEAEKLASHAQAQVEQEKTMRMKAEELSLQAEGQTQSHNMRCSRLEAQSLAERDKRLEAEQLVLHAQAQAEQERAKRVKAEEMISQAERRAQDQSMRCSNMESQFVSEMNNRLEAEKLASRAQAQVEQEKAKRVEAEELISQAEKRAQDQSVRCSSLEAECLSERGKRSEAEQLASLVQAQAEQEKAKRVKAEELISQAEKRAQGQSMRCSNIEAELRSEQEKVSEARRQAECERARRVQAEEQSESARMEHIKVEQCASELENQLTKRKDEMSLLNQLVDDNARLAQSQKEELESLAVKYCLQKELLETGFNKCLTRLNMFSQYETRGRSNARSRVGSIGREPSISQDILRSPLQHRFFPFMDESTCGLKSAVQQLLHKTSHFAPNSICNTMRTAVVTRVETVQDLTIAKNYLRRKDSILEENQRLGIAVQGLSPPASKVFRDLFPRIALDDRVGEHLLLHGTKHAKTIARFGFDERLAKESGLYGLGVYLTDESCKAFQYTDRDKEEKTMILSRVALGDAFYAKGSMLQAKRPPLRNAQDESAGCYDSIVANVGISNGMSLSFQQHREFVVFDGDQVCPDLIIYFTVQ
mmetsp:Transcript_71259/g.137597  ORF Transcript_71259/g.137597 Transcript_71259/m.137597 type:complete len:774 (+) Transcript_71259:70-2391(+)